MDGSGRHYANRKKSERERQILSDVTNMWNPEKKSIEIEKEWWLPGTGGEGKRVI